MRKILLATAVVFVGSNAWAETSEYTCPEGSASTLHCFTCGSNCTMTLDTSTGHAVVEGTGEMIGDGGLKADNYSAWGKYKNSFKSLEVRSGITSIEGHAFQGTTVETVTIPNTVTTIGNSAFFHAEKLQNIVIPDSVTTIGRSAFNSATNLNNLIIPDSVTTIGDWAFTDTTMKELVIPDSVKKIGYSAFCRSGIKNLTIPDTLVLESLPGSGGPTPAKISQTFEGSSLKTVTCAGGGDTSMCDALLKKGGKNIQSVSRPNYLLDENGNIVERYAYDENGNKYTTATYEYNEDGHLIKEYNAQGELIATYGYDNNGKQYLLTADGKLSLKNADGSTSIYNKDGNLVGIKGKKIYTVEEAEAVTAHGDKFHVSLTYK